MKTICIEQLEDGTYSVYDESQGGEDMVAAESMPGMGAPAGKDSQPAATVDEALDLARQLLTGDEESPDEQMMTGYNKGKSTAKPMAKPMMSPGKVFGE